MTDRPLTKQQELALLLLARDFVSARTRGSMPSLVRRGLVHRDSTYWRGRRTDVFELTPEGRKVVRAIRRARRPSA